MGELSITIIICLIQLVLGLMGIHVSLKPPLPKYYKYWIFAFISVGIIGICFTGWMSHKSECAQAQANIEIHKAQTAAAAANTAATKANSTATDILNETKNVLEELRNAKEKLENQINETSKETNTKINKWQTDTESAVGKLLSPPRTLTLDQRKIIISALKNSPPIKIEAIRHQQGCDECQRYADQLAEVIKRAGWVIQDEPKLLIQLREENGIWVYIHDRNKVPAQADVLRNAFKAAGIATQGAEADFVDEDKVEIIVGFP